MHHGLPQFLGVDLSGMTRVGERTGGAVVLDDRRVLDREVGCTLLEILGRVAAGTHDLVDQLIGVGHGNSGIIYEVCLNTGPARGETRAVGGAQLMEMNNARARRARLASSRSARVALPCSLFDRTVILGTELLLQLCASRARPATSANDRSNHKLPQQQLRRLSTSRSYYP